MVRSSREHRCLLPCSLGQLGHAAKDDRMENLRMAANRSSDHIISSDKATQPAFAEMCL